MTKINAVSSIILSLYDIYNKPFMSNLKRILNKLYQSEQPMSLVELLSLLSEALETTLDEKLLRAGPLEDMALQLNEIIQLLVAQYPDCPVDDLRYRLAHLYMRDSRWKEAECQFLCLGDYLETEARIYSTLCQLKLCENELDRKKTEAQITTLAEKFRKLPPKNQKRRSIQEQHYNLLEMMIYAGSLNHKLLENYYQQGSTKADIKVRTKEYPTWLPISRFRLTYLIEACKSFLILDLTEKKVLTQLGYSELQMSPSTRKLAEALAVNYPQRVIRKSLEDQLGITREATFSDLKKNLCEVLNNSDAISVNRNDSFEPGYRLEHPFLLVLKR